jgi:hypothetical protein
VLLYLAVQPIPQYPDGEDRESQLLEAPEF